MSSSQPFLGSKISLISKASIRYEGILFSIDTKQSTVALSKVRSFGTENRPCEKSVPPRDEVYEYIIFRGSDIHDLHVCEPPKPEEPQILHQDPAIVTISQNTIPRGEVPSPASNLDSTGSSFQPHPARPPTFSTQHKSENSKREPINVQSHQHHKASKETSNLQEGQIISQTSPTPLLSASELNHATRDPNKTNEYQGFRMQAPTNGGGRGSQSRGPINSHTQYSGYQNDSEPVNYRSRGGGGYSRGPSGGYSNENNRGPSGGYSNENNRGSSGGYSNENNRGPSGGYSNENNRGPTGGYSNENNRGPTAGYSNENNRGPSGGYSNENNRGPTGGYSNENNRGPSGGYYDSYGYGGQDYYSRGNYRYNSGPRYHSEATNGSTASYRGGHRTASGTNYNRYEASSSYRQGSYSVAGGNRSNSNKPQYKEDYDFESENAKIADELAKLTVNAAHKASESDVAGENDSNHSNDVYLPTSNQEEKQPSASGDQSEDNGLHCYDKTKSFFDTISSESVDRANGVRITQMNRNEERRVNVETFGSSGGQNSYVGGFRGRGGPRRDGANGYYNNRGGNYYAIRRGSNNPKSYGGISGWSSRPQVVAQQY